MKKVIFLIVLISVAFAGCKKDPVITEPYDFGYQYFPLRVGDSAVYQVNHIFWNDFDNTIDTTNFFLCEYIESATTNLAGDSLFRIERMKKNATQDPWALDSIWFALRNKNEAIRVENNYSFVKMVFPIAEDVTWNGNAHNIIGEREIKCVKIEPVSIGGIAYDKAVFIDMERDTSRIHSDVETETYAHNVGLVHVFKEHVYKEFNSISGDFEIKSGYRTVQTRIR
jgi:hypothetical protein